LLLEADGARDTKDMGLNDLTATIKELLAPPMIKTFKTLVPRMYIIHTKLIGYGCPFYSINLAK
jgi:hypothetical protein